MKTESASRSSTRESRISSTAGLAVIVSQSRFDNYASPTRCGNQTSSCSEPINFRGGLAQYSLLLVFGQVGDTALNYIHPALIRTAEQYHRPIRPKHDSFRSKGCQSNLQVGIEIGFCPGLPTCF